MKKKLTVAIASSAVILFAATGCGLVVNQDAIRPYEPSDGFSVNVQDIKVRNALIVTEDGTAAVFIAGITTSGESAILNLNIKNKDGVWNQHKITVEGGLANAGTPQHYEVQISDLGAKPGDLLEATVQYGNSVTEAFYLPVLSSSMTEYSHLLG